MRSAKNNPVPVTGDTLVLSVSDEEGNLRPKTERDEPIPQTASWLKTEIEAEEAIVHQKVYDAEFK